MCSLIVTINLTPVKVPPNSQLRKVTFDFKRKVCNKNTEILGLHKWGQIPLRNIEIGLAFT